MSQKIRYPVRHQHTKRILGFIYTQEVAGKTLITAVDAQEALTTNLAIKWDMAMWSHLKAHFGYDCLAIGCNEAKEVEF